MRTTKGQKRVRVVVATTVMLSFISFWRAAAIVLNDLGSSAYYVGGIAEKAIGRSAPWFILGVMLFSYAVRAVYVESCAMFTRGGVYRVVKEAMGGTLAKLSVSALMFDYVLTGPISGVSAGQYIVGLGNELLTLLHLPVAIPTAAGSAAIAIAITLYFWHQNILGIEESSDKAMKIMGVTTVMVVVMIAWCGVTLWQRGATLPPFELHLSDEALGWLGGTGWEKRLGALGILIAFGHSILAMSGEESLAQVNREIAHPKVPNLIKAGLIIFLFTMLTTGLVSFFAVMIIPDDVRMSTYSDNLVGGLALYIVGPLSVGLSLIFLVLLATALVNLVTKRVATEWGGAFTVVFFVIFWLSERIHHRRGAALQHIEKFNVRYMAELEPETVAVRPGCKVVPVRDPGNLRHLDRALRDAEGEDVDVVVPTVKVERELVATGSNPNFTPDEQAIFTAVVELAEKHGKSVVPLVLTSNDAFFAVARTAQELGAREVVLGRSGRLAPDGQAEAS